MKYITALFLLSASLSYAESPDTTSAPKVEFHAVRLQEQINIDGKLNESVWQNDEGVTAFTQREPVEKGQPSQRTVIHVAYDDAALYIGARMYDTAADSIVANLSRKDVLVNSDRLMVYIDAYHDKRTGFYFGVNAGGTQFDGTLLNDEWDDDSWDGVWEGKASIDKDGWTVEMRIPFSQLRFQQASEYVWGINFLREIPRKNERDYIVFTPKNGSGFVSRFVDLKGIENISPPRQLEVLPYVTTKAEYLQHAPNDPFVTGSKYTPRFGGDLKFGLGSNLTLNATINPDFGQVEVDPAVVNLSDVETYFQEKRPFFIEGSTIFNFGQGGSNNNWGFNFPNPTFLYTRRIGRAPQGSAPSADFVNIPSGTDILGAAKLSGKVGDNWSVGTIQAVTAREYADLQTAGQRSQAEVEPLTYYGIARAQKEFNSGSQALGLLTTFTDRAFSDDNLRSEINKSASVTGLDGWTFLDADKMWVISGWAATSNITGSSTQTTNVQENSRHYFQRPDADYLHVDSTATSMTGYAARFSLNKQKGNFYMNTAFGIINPKFEVNDLGFLSRTDVINAHFVASYRWTVPKDFYRYIELGGAAFRSYDFGGDRIWDGVFHFGYIEFPSFASINWNFAYNPQTYSTRRTRGGPLMVTPPGYQIDLYPASNRSSNLIFDGEWYTYQASYERQSNLYFGVEWRPASNFSFKVSPELDRDFESSQYVGTFDDPLATATYGKRYVFAEMNQLTFSAGIRINWTFSPSLSFQMYIQPLISAGDYHDFKELARPKSYDFNHYANTTLTSDGANYIADPDGTGPVPAIEFSNPNFNLKSVRGNAILRWEYFPGSTVYFVWTQSRSEVDEVGEFQFNHSIGQLFDNSPDNIFLMKFSYWWSL